MCLIFLDVSYVSAGNNSTIKLEKAEVNIINGYDKTEHFVGKYMSEEALQIAVNRREAKSKGEKERHSHLNAEFKRIAREIRKPPSVINVKK